ncbi:MAG: hypothetical protein GXP16_03790 [Gammaproteobacteria bacterium]|nr:hypothetical protein [Gammaproteobacteria bacterium]
MSKIEFYYDFRSPFAYFATQRMELLTNAGAEITWRPVFVDVLLNLQQNQPLWSETVDPFCPPKRAHFMADIFRLIEFWKIPFNMPYSAKPDGNQAMAIAALLEQAGTEHADFRNAIFNAIWQNQQDPNDSSVLQACLGQHDLKLLEQAPTEGVELLTKNTQAAYERGVFGVPTFMFNEEVYFGADRMELLAARLTASTS